MKISGTSLKNAFVETIALLYILLLVYAALSKLFDFEGFRRQLFMSPILSSHATWLVWSVPIGEIFISILLATPKTRLFGLFCALNLMGMFTVYIYLILNYASHVPCSCGGILEDMGWQAHLIFNIVFMLLAFFALLIGLYGRYNTKYSRKALGISILVITAVLTLSSMAVIQLYKVSEKIVHHQNRFQRRFPHPSVTEFAKAKLAFNSYYIAGIDEKRVYLGNSTAPLHVLIYDLNLKKPITEIIRIDTTGINFNATQLRIEAGKFYLYNGNVPYLFSGNTKDWKGSILHVHLKRFTLAEPLSGELVVRTFAPLNGENIIGLQPLTLSGLAHYESNLLKKQTDGIFDTDGNLMTYGQRFVYLYRYRNAFVVSNRELATILTGKTIDTVSHAQIQVGQDKHSGLTQFEKIPLTVNRLAALHKNLLFVNSNLPGKQDSDKLWSQASIIDVYDIRDGSYRYSFPLYHVEGKKLDNFKVYENHIYLINDKWVVRYDLKAKLMGDYENTPGQVQGSDRKPVTE